MKHEEYSTYRAGRDAEKRTVDSTESAGHPPEPQVRLIAGTAAIAAGSAWLVWAYLNEGTGGGLDGPVSEISATLVTAGKLLTVAQNLFMLPAAIVLMHLMRRDRPQLNLLLTACGIISLTSWSYAAASATNNPAVEASYLFLSAVWWIGVGSSILRERKIYGVFTLVLGIFAFWDAAVTAANAPFWLFVTAAPKLPLSWIWDFWTGIMILGRK